MHQNVEFADSLLTQASELIRELKDKYNLGDGE
jgi:hypothetical protein